MNEHEHELFEAELLQIRPAKLPDDLAERLTAAQPSLSRRSEHLARASQQAQRWPLLRWLAPAAASTVGLVAFAIWLNFPEHRTSTSASTAMASPTLRADDVEIDRQLIGTFETVATLPSGEPVRVRCREWMDEVVLRDTAHGVAIERRTPRFEIVPVSFETF